MWNKLALNLYVFYMLEIPADYCTHTHTHTCTQAKSRSSDCQPMKNNSKEKLSP